MRVCAWCEKVMDEGAEGAPTSHGMCLRCYPAAVGEEIVSLPAMTREQLDELPYGAIRLDNEDRIVDYNKAESVLAHRSRDDVVGRNFFLEVAPCTNVAELAGWLHSAREAGETRQIRVEFVFEFTFGRAAVDIALLHDARRQSSHILVRSTAQEFDSA